MDSLTGHLGSEGFPGVLDEVVDAMKDLGESELPIPGPISPDLDYLAHLAPTFDMDSTTDLLPVGEGVFESADQAVDNITEHFEQDLSLSTPEYSEHLELNLPLPLLEDTAYTFSSPDSPTPGGAPSFPAAPAIVSGASTVPPYVVSDWEKSMYYHGLSRNPPELLYRSDLLENPFPFPKGSPNVPTKTPRGVHDTPLNAVWDTVAPKICKLLKDLNIRYSVVKVARFLTRGEYKDTLGPVVIWIATHPTTTTAKNAHDASPGILALLKDSGVEGAVVEWYEGAIEELSGPVLLPVTGSEDPTHYVRRFLTPALGMPIARQDDAQGSVGLFFHEVKYKHGIPSAKVFGVTCCHVLRKGKDKFVKYDFEDTGTPPQFVWVNGSRRFQRGLEEIEACISNHSESIDVLTMRSARLEAKLKSGNPEEAAVDKAAVKAKKELAKMKKDIGVLEDFYEDVKSQWGDIASRNVGRLDWAPEISVDVQGHRYTKDIATFELNADKFKAHFKGNVVDLGSKFTSTQLADMFNPRGDGSRRTEYQIPDDRLLRIKDFVPRDLLKAPNGVDKDGNPCLFVMKDGNTTDLTVGRLAGLEAYTSNDLGIESIELVIYNYDKKSGPFSLKGDSGSLVFDPDGRMVGILHSGEKRGLTEHVTYATPAWWAIEQIRVRYPHADFNRTTFQV